MSDEELIARLHLPWPKDANVGEVTLPTWVLALTAEAADRIEELEAKLKTTDEIGLAFEEDAGQLREKLAAAEKERDEWRSLSEATIKDDAAKNIHYAEIQAKLAKAVKCQYLNDCIEMVDELYDSSLAAKARTTLAELKGEQP